jgi:hypothetical protein
MNRTAWLQDRRMQKFRDVLSRWERKELSALEAAEILGVSERQFRRCRGAMRRRVLAGSSIGAWARPRCGVCRWTRWPGCLPNIGRIISDGT